MLDIKFIRENLDLVKKSTKEKGYKIDVDEAIKLDDERKSILAKVEVVNHIPVVEMRCVGMPYLECGDTYLSYTRRYVCRTYILSRTLSGIQALFDSFSSDCDKDYPVPKVSQQNQINANKTEIKQTQEEVDEVDNRVSTVDNRVTTVDNRVTGVDNRVTQVNNLVAQKANITDLNATNANVQYLSANKANVSDLQATNVAVQNLDANKASVAQLNAVNARFGSLNADNITSGTVATSRLNMTEIASSLSSQSISCQTMSCRTLRVNSAYYSAKRVVISGTPYWILAQ